MFERGSTGSRATRPLLASAGMCHCDASNGNRGYVGYVQAVALQNLIYNCLNVHHGFRRVWYYRRLQGVEALYACCFFFELDFKDLRLQVDQF